MESGKSSASGFFRLFLGLCGFWFLASTRLHISGFFLQSNFPCKTLGFCFSVSLAFEWLGPAVVPALKLTVPFCSRTHCHPTPLPCVFKFKRKKWTSPAKAECLPRCSQLWRGGGECHLDHMGCLGFVGKGRIAEKGVYSIS